MISGPMKKNNRLPVIFMLSLCMLMPLHAAENNLAGLMAGLASKGQREAYFVEERHASYLNSPVTTQGRLKAIPPDRLEKIIVAPEAITQVVTGDHIIQSRDGGKQQEISLDQVPELSVAIDTLRAMVFGNLKYLQKTFTADYKIHEQHWTLLLRPRSPESGAQLKSIRISGSRDNITEFLVTDVNGDYSKTRLYEHEKK